MIRRGKNGFLKRGLEFFVGLLMHVVFGVACAVGWFATFPLFIWYWITDDASVHDRVKRFGQAEDGAAGIVLFNGHPRETISSRLGRRLRAGKIDWMTINLNRLLNVFEPGHAEKAIQQYTEELPL